MARRWRIRSLEPERIAALSQAAGIPAVVAQLLLGRGICEPDVVRGFLAAKLSELRDPHDLPGVTAAAELLHASMAAKKQIVIYGDYDVDGVSGTSLLWQCLKLLGANVSYYLPHRLEEGYGLNCEALSSLAEQGAQVVVTVDCGIASLLEAEHARQLGLELIVTDHHEMAATLPDAAAIVHPRLPGKFYPFAGLCGAGVAFKLAWAVCQCASQSKKVSEPMRDFLVRAVSLAALGTVADVVPLVDENRILVRYGLTGLKHQPTLGLTELMRVSKLLESPRLTSEDIAFSLAPRINAAGRLGQARLAVELLTTNIETRARELAEYIDELNRSRQHLERCILKSASKQIQEQFDAEQDAAFVLADHDWHPGVIGIVAGRLAERHHRPVVLIALDKTGVKCGVGSARSVPGFNLHEALSACSEHLLGHGGHAAAAGLKIQPENIERFRTDFCEYAAGQIAEADRVAELWIDAEALFSAFTLKTVEQIESLAPFGEGNHRPLLCASGVKLNGPPKLMGEGDRHLTLRVEQHGILFRAVAFGHGERLPEFEDPQCLLDVAFRPVINQFNGFRKVELHLTDWRPAAGP